MGCHFRRNPKAEEAQPFRRSNHLNNPRSYACKRIYPAPITYSSFASFVPRATLSNNRDALSFLKLISATIMVFPNHAGGIVLRFKRSRHRYSQPCRRERRFHYVRCSQASRRERQHEFVSGTVTDRFEVRCIVTPHHFYKNSESPR